MTQQHRIFFPSVLFLAAWLVFIPTICAAQAGPQEPAASPLDQAQSLITSGKTGAAIALLKSTPRTDSNQAQIDHLLGLAYYQQGDYSQAIEFLSSSERQAQDGTKQSRQAIQLLGMSHYLLGHVKEAVPFLERASKLSPADVETTYALGVSLIQNREIEKARETFARMFGVAPTSASAYLINAQMMIRQQFEEFAEKELQKALELDPKLPQANFLLGELAIYRANIDLGIDLMQKEIAINPAFAMPYYRLGEALTRQLKWEQAIAPLQKSIWLNPFFSGPYIVLGKVYLKTGDLGNAESILRHALKMDTNNYSGHYILAQVLQQSGKAEEAKKEFELADRLRTTADK
jgi:tetratricopeptide (TPR) repeat protein